VGSNPPTQNGQDPLPADDNRLALRVRQGDHEAFRALYDRHGSAVLAVAQSVVRDRATAEDIVHDVFTGFWRNPHTFEPSRGHFVAWLLRVTRNRGIDILRKRRDVAFANAPASADGEPVDPGHWLQDPDPSPETQAVSTGLAGDVRAALRSLPDDHRMLLEMAYFGGLTQREIAERLNRPLGTVKTQMRTSLKRLANVSSIRGWATSKADDQLVGEERGGAGSWDPARVQRHSEIGPETS
jgi:RNA polymerase sigma-70 factor (ECF subfamily)